MSDTIRKTEENGNVYELVKTESKELEDGTVITIEQWERVEQ